MAILLQNVVNRQKNEIYQAPKSILVRRTATSHLLSVLDVPLIKVIKGPRRCGKSTLAMEGLKSKRFAYINFEDDGVPPDVSGDDVMEALTNVYGEVDFYFFDEIQNMDRWEPFLHRLHREQRNCIVTGSNAHLLSSELATALTGRHVAIELLPFSYSEFLSVYTSPPQDAFETYITKGGFPQVVQGLVDGSSYLSALWDAVVLKDVVQRHKVRNVSALNTCYQILLNSISSKFNFESLVRALSQNVSAPTVKNFVRFANEAYLICDLRAFSLSAKKRHKTDRKSYVYDTGFVKSMNISGGPDWGRLLENVVFLELLRRGLRPNIELFYFNTKNNYEVDFLIRKGESYELIQVIWALGEQKTKEREIRALSEAAKELNASSLKIITRGHQETVTQNGIQIEILPAHNWLLNNY